MDGALFDDLQLNKATIDIVNVGRIPSGIATVEIHSLTLAIHPLPPPSNLADYTVVSQSSRTMKWASFVPTVRVEIHSLFPNASSAKMTGSTQRLVIVWSLKYNDGFPKDAEQGQLFCFKTQFHIPTKTEMWIPCEDASEYLKPIEERKKSDSQKAN